MVMNVMEREILNEVVDLDLSLTKCDVTSMETAVE